MNMRLPWIPGLIILLSGIVSCNGDHVTQNASQSSTDPTDESNISAPSEEVRPAFTHKMIKKTGENLFASLAYECPECTFEQWESIVAPPGWSKGPAQIALFSTRDSVMRSHPSVEDHADSVDFLDDVPGDEYKVIAVTLNGRLHENGPNGIVAEVQVMRDTRLVFNSGMRIHELTDPEGHVFVLFVHHVDRGNWQNADFQSADALDYFTAPDGWTYSTRILDEELALDSNNSDGVVSVLAIRGEISSTWEKR